MASGQAQARLRHTSIKNGERAAMSIESKGDRQEARSEFGHLGDRLRLSSPQVAQISPGEDEGHGEHQYQDEDRADSQLGRLLINRYLQSRSWGSGGRATRSRPSRKVSASGSANEPRLRRCRTTTVNLKRPTPVHIRVRPAKATSR